MAPDDVAILEADAWFGRLDGGHRGALLAAGRISAVAAGARLYGVGDPPSGLWAVLTGELRLIAYPAVGIEVVAALLRPGNWFGELATLDGGPQPHEALAFVDSRVLHVPVAALDRAATQRPRLYRDVGLLVCERQRASFDVLGRTLAQPVAVRLARTLGLAAEGGATLQLRQADLAAAIGVSRQTLNGELKKLERMGLVELAYARITVPDPALLAAYGRVPA